MGEAAQANHSGYCFSRDGAGTTATESSGELVSKCRFLTNVHSSVIHKAKK